MLTKEIIELEKKYIMPTYKRFPVAIVRGEGARVWDADGKEYLDLVAGVAVNSVGHCHPKVVEALQSQAALLIHASNLYYTEPQVRLAELLVKNSACDKVFFANSGAEAVEGAIKLVRKYFRKVKGQDRYEVITAHRSFHGRTLGALAATGQVKYQADFEPLVAGFIHVPYNDPAALRKAVTPRTAAIMIEPVQGEGGVHPATSEYMEVIEDLRREHGLLVIFDEIQCGLGRTGRLFAYEHYGVEPDIMTLAKALGGGAAIGAILAKEEVAQVFQPGSHGSTFGGNPLAAAAALAAVTAILDEGLIENARAVGHYFYQSLVNLQGEFPLIKEVRGLGLMLGAELDREARPVVELCLQQGLLVNVTEGNVLRFIPPLVITKEQVDWAINVLRQSLEKFTLSGGVDA